MRLFPSLFLLVVAIPLCAQQSGEEVDSCFECHAELEDNLGEPAHVFENDIHRQNGFSCVDCHGGDPTSYDPEVSMSPARGFVGKIDRQQIPNACAHCHSNPDLMHRFDPQQRVDQLAQYRTSVHGKMLAAGDDKVATCTDCHSVHDIREVRHALSPVHPVHLPKTCAGCHADEEHMQEYSISTEQYAEYTDSVHWEAISVRGDLSAPTCATCHGNHGAAPPGVGDVNQVCGSCHVVFQQAFNESPHQDAFEMMGLPACIVCHGNHEILPPTLEMLGVGEEATCTNCHSEGDAAYSVAASMKSELDRLHQELDDSRELLDRAEDSGMEVSDGFLQWTSANEQLVKARVEVHRFQLEPISEAVEEGVRLASASREIGAEALEERDFRRKGLALSLILIVITMVGLGLAVRSLESRGRAGSGEDFG